MSLKDFLICILLVLRLPRYPSVYVGDDVSLKCTGTGEPITWKINNKTVSHTDALMVLTMVTSANNGEYKCARSEQESDSHDLKVLGINFILQNYIFITFALAVLQDASLSLRVGAPCAVIPSTRGRCGRQR